MIFFNCSFLEKVFSEISLENPQIFSVELSSKESGKAKRIRGFWWMIDLLVSRFTETIIFFNRKGSTVSLESLSKELESSTSSSLDSFGCK